MNHSWGHSQNYLMDAFTIGYEWYEPLIFSSFSSQEDKADKADKAEREDEEKGKRKKKSTTSTSTTRSRAAKSRPVTSRDKDKTPKARWGTNRGNPGNQAWILVFVSKVGDFGWFSLEAWMWYFHELGLSIDRVIFIQQMYRIEVGNMATVIIEDHMTCWKGCYPWRIGQMRRMRYPMLPRSPRMMNSLAETQMFWYVLMGWTDHVPTKSYWSPMWLKSSLFLSNIVFICGYIPIDVSRFRRDQQLLGTRRTITRLTSGLGESAIHCVQLVGNRLLQRRNGAEGCRPFWGWFPEGIIVAARNSLLITKASVS